MALPPWGSTCTTLPAYAGLCHEVCYPDSYGQQLWRWPGSHSIPQAPWCSKCHKEPGSFLYYLFKPTACVCMYSLVKGSTSYCWDFDIKLTLSFKAWGLLTQLSEAKTIRKILLVLLSLVLSQVFLKNQQKLGSRDNWDVFDLCQLKSPEKASGTSHFQRTFEGSMALWRGKTWGNLKLCSHLGTLSLLVVWWERSGFTSLSGWPCLFHTVVITGFSFQLSFSCYTCIRHGVLKRTLISFFRGQLHFI